ncbi:MAG: GDP-L-fucose synthase [Eubacteriales bacterium]|nr:GDP-L-fucose synthase [Eubacteriales bacterium]
MNKDSKIYIAGHTGLLGTNTLNYLRSEGYFNFILKTHSELDLTNQAETEAFFMTEKPEYVFHMAGLVGGIQSNSKRMAEFTMENVKMTANVIDAAHKAGVKKLLYLGSSCIYPTKSVQPIREEYLLTGPLEPTNEGYAIAKILGVKLCQYYYQQYGDLFISCIPANVYGPGDNFDEKENHVIPALIKRVHNAKINNIRQVTVWGTGNPRREFLFIEDAVKACVFLMNHYSDDAVLNAGVGKTTSIRELAETVVRVVGYEGELVFDTSKPDGMLERMLDSTKLNEMGWKANTALHEGIQKTYAWFLENML